MRMMTISCRVLVGVVVILSLSLGPSAPRAQEGTALDGLDAFITSGLGEWQVPGLALGVIKDGKLLIAKGYGVRDVEAELPVTTATVMAIGSASKSFTATVVAMLVDDEVIDWDRPVRTYLPDFQMWDDYATRHMTPRDLLSHRSGLPRHDRVWEGRNFTRKELFDRLRYLEPNVSFRERYQYQNLMVMTAGYLAERVTGQTWEDLVRDRILRPLGMTASNTSIADSQKAENFAQPYMLQEGRVVRVPFLNINAIGPAGSINSSIDDMLKYLRFRMDMGEAAGRRLVSRANAVLMQTPQVPLVPAPDIEEIAFSTYGLGLVLDSYRGRTMMRHGGGIDGFSAEMSWMPRERIGLIVLTNRGGNPLSRMVARHVYDRLLDLPPIDWKERQRAASREAAALAKAAREKWDRERPPNAMAPRDLGAYVGAYEHGGYGTMTIRQGKNALELAFDKFVVSLKHHHDDVFEVDERGEIPGIIPVTGLVKFQGDARGVDKLLIPFESALPDIAFVRR